MQDQIVRTQNVTLEQRIQRWFLIQLGRSFKLFFVTLWRMRVTLLWLVALFMLVSVVQHGFWLWLLLVIGAFVHPITREHASLCYADFVREILNFKVRRAVKRGNVFLRKVGLVSRNDEETYEISLLKDDEKTTVTLYEPLPGLSVDDFTKRVRDFRRHFNAVRVLDEDLGDGSVKITFMRTDPLAGIRPGQVAASVSAVGGRLENGEDLVVDLEDASHIIVQGMTRSGKSVLSQTLLAQWSRSEAVEVWGVDPNRMLLAPLKNEQTEDHLVLGTQDPEAAVDLLNRFVAEMDARIVELEQRGIDKFSVFDADTPIMLMVLEEYAALLRAVEDADRVNKTKNMPVIKAKVARLVSEGAKVGMRVLMIVQRADASLVDGSTRAQFGTRITMGVDNADAVSMLHPMADSELTAEATKFRNGRFLMDQHRKTFIGQADLLDYAEYKMVANI